MIYRCPICGHRCDATYESVFCAYCGIDHGLPEECGELMVFEDQVEKEWFKANAGGDGQ